MENQEKVLQQRRNGFVWNALSSLITALSSVLLLMIVKRFAGIEIGAYYAVAVAVANVLINIGNLNVIGYQISDVKETFSFAEYLLLRKTSVFFMIVIAAIYVFLHDYDVVKSMVVFLYCVYRGIYAYADVYQGRYQQKGRVDLAGKLQFFKVLIPDAALSICVILHCRIEVALIVGIIVGIFFLKLYNKKNFLDFDNREESANRYKCALLFKQCLPLFFNAFATTYIMNSSKYAIDKILSDEMQVYYSILLLPVTTVHMIAGFVYRPVITEYANIWNQGKVIMFSRNVWKITSIILGGTLIIVGVACPIILPILKWLYAANELAEYKKVFIILLVAGGMNALNTFFSFVLTIMRLQNHMFWIYGCSFILALVLPDLFVVRHGIEGAAISFLLLLSIQLGLILIIYAYGMLTEKRKCDLT